MIDIGMSKAELAFSAVGAVVGLFGLAVILFKTVMWLITPHEDEED